jgi:hypothetical protein
MNQTTIRIFSCLFALLLIMPSGYSQTKILKTGNGFSLMRNGSPYYVKGVGGEVNLGKVLEIGGNSIRTWGSENAQQVLDEAHKKDFP